MIVMANVSKTNVWHYAEQVCFSHDPVSTEFLSREIWTGCHSRSVLSYFRKLAIFRKIFIVSDSAHIFLEFEVKVDTTGCFKFVKKSVVVHLVINLVLRKK